MLKLKIDNDRNNYGQDLILSAIYEVNHYLNKGERNGEIHMSYDLENRSATFELSTGIQSIILLADVYNYNDPINRLSALWSNKEMYEFLCDCAGPNGTPKAFCSINGDFAFDQILDELDDLSGNQIIITLINIEYDEKNDQLTYGIKITIRAA